MQDPNAAGFSVLVYIFAYIDSCVAELLLLLLQFIFFPPCGWKIILETEKRSADDLHLPTYIEKKTDISISKACSLDDR